MTRTGTGIVTREPPVRVHRLNCGTMRPLGGRLLDGRRGYLRRATMVCHCLLVEADDGLVLVDTGFGVGDDAGGLPDFPHATVHAFAAERDAVDARATRKDRGRYRPAHFSHGPHWRTYDAAGGEEWFGFRAVPEIAGLPGLLLVPLAGHNRGRAGVREHRDEVDVFCSHAPVELEQRDCR